MSSTLSQTDERFFCLSFRYLADCGICRFSDQWQREKSVRLLRNRWEVRLSYHSALHHGPKTSVHRKRGRVAFRSIQKYDPLGSMASGHVILSKILVIRPHFSLPTRIRRCFSAQSIVDGEDFDSLLDETTCQASINLVAQFTTPLQDSSISAHIHSFDDSLSLCHTCKSWHVCSSFSLSSVKRVKCRLVSV